MLEKYSKLLTVGFAIAVVIFATGLAAADEKNDALPPLPAGGQESPSKRYLTAYDSMSTADWLLKREMNEDAAMLYGEAMKMFQQLASDYPLWQTNLVAFRINYCREGLNKALGAKKPDYGQAVSSSQVSAPSVPKETSRRQKSSESDSAKELADKIQKGTELEKEGDFNGALELYRFVLERNNQDTKALGGAGRCLLKMGKLDEARDLLFQWSIIPSPDNGVNLLLVLILCCDKQFAKALQLAEIVLNEDKSNAEAHVIMGVALAGTGQTDAAIAEMQKALSLNARLPEAHYNLARLILKKSAKNKPTAIAYYLNALKFGAAPDPELAKRLQK